MLWYIKKEHVEEFTQKAREIEGKGIRPFIELAEGFCKEGKGISFYGVLGSGKSNFPLMMAQKIELTGEYEKVYIDLEGR